MCTLDVLFKQKLPDIVQICSVLCTINCILVIYPVFAANAPILVYKMVVNWFKKRIDILFDETGNWLFILEKLTKKFFILRTLVYLAWVGEYDT